MGQKRGRDSKAQAQAVESKKRKKAAKSGPASEDGGWDGVVGLEDLNWKEVAMPDRMEDAGGFFGLEEIDGVDVIRSQGHGEVRFTVWKYILMLNSQQCTDVWVSNRRNRASRRILS